MNIKTAFFGVLLGVLFFALGPSKALANCDEIVHDPANPGKTGGTLFFVWPRLDTSVEITRATAYGCVAVGNGVEHESFTFMGTGQDLKYPNVPLSAVCTVGVKEIIMYGNPLENTMATEWSLHEQFDCDNGYKAQRSTTYNEVDGMVVKVFTVAGEGTQLNGKNDPTPTPTPAASALKVTSTSKSKVVKGVSSPDEIAVEQSQSLAPTNENKVEKKTCFLWFCW